MVTRREFIAGLGGAAASSAWPLAARAQQPALPVVGIVTGGSAEPVDPSAPQTIAFGKGLNEAGYFVGRNVTFERHFLEGQYDRAPAVMADLVRRGVAVIFAQAPPAIAIAAQAATVTIPIPIVFAVGDDPVKLGLGACLFNRGGNVLAQDRRCHGRGAVPW
jgi:putative ABC transport system substrate-binding protein